MWIENAYIPIDNQDPFKRIKEGAIGIIYFNGNHNVILKKDKLNRSELVGDNIKIIMNTKRGGFDIFENNLGKKNFMSYEIFSSRIIFRNNIFFIEID